MTHKQQKSKWLVPQVVGACLLFAVLPTFAQSPPPFWDNFKNQKVFQIGRTVCEGAEDVAIDNVGQWVYIYGRGGTKWSKWSVDSLFAKASLDSTSFSCLDNSKTLGRPQRSSMLVRFISGQGGNILAFDSGTKRLWQLDSTHTALSSLGLPTELHKENLNEWFFVMTNSHRLIGYRYMPEGYYVWEESQGMLKLIWQSNSIHLSKSKLDIYPIKSNKTQNICFVRSLKVIAFCE